MKDTVMVTVYDGTPPTIDSPDDIEYEEGATGNEITWAPSDLHPSSYEVFVNGALLYSDTWIGGSITISVDGLVAGSYNYTVVVTDVGGNTVSDSVFVTVTSATTTPTTSTTPTEPTEGIDIIIVIAIAGAGGVILIIVIYVCKKKQSGE